MDQEAMRKLANQLRNAGRGGPQKGFFAGAGAIVALVAGGVALNASLFNGMASAYENALSNGGGRYSGWWAPCY